MMVLLSSSKVVSSIELMLLLAINYQTIEVSKVYVVPPVVGSQSTVEVTQFVAASEVSENAIKPY